MNAADTARDTVVTALTSDFLRLRCAEFIIRKSESRITCDRARSRFPFRPFKIVYTVDSKAVSNDVINCCFSSGELVHTVRGGGGAYKSAFVSDIKLYYYYEFLKVLT